MKISARNQLKATVKSITPGPVNAEVVLELAGGQEVVAVITKASLTSLGIEEGATAYAIVKASSVLVGVD